MNYPWHQQTLTRLQALLTENLLPNAIALTCPPGWGHEALAAQAALNLLGINGTPVIDEFAHPDFRWIVPDGAVIKIDQIRRINEFAVQTPQIAPRKVAAIVDAHLLNTNAANALLKTLEEPPPNTHLLLATPHWGKLLPTIRSRCQRFSVAPDMALASNWLAEQGMPMDADQLAEFGYAPLTAIAAGQDNALDFGVWLPSIVSAPLADTVEQIISGDVVTLLGRWYRRIIMHLAQPQGGDKRIPNCEADAQALIQFSDQLLSTRRQIEGSNSANAKLLTEALIVRWVRLQRTRTP